MFADTIKLIEKKYETKRATKLQNYIDEKKVVYTGNPRLTEIDSQINKLGINAARSALSINLTERGNILKELEKQISELRKEKINILNKFGISDSPNFDCNKCNDTGYISTKQGSQMCSCFKQELINESYNNSNLYKLKNETFDKFNTSLFSDEVNIEKYKFNVSPRENIKKIKALSENFIDNFENESQRNLLFSGTPGLGKTFLSSCIANEILKKGYTVLYQTAPLLFDSIFSNKYSKFPGDKTLYDDLFKVNLLIIDDLGTENLSDAKFSELFTILNARLLYPNTKTIISTNLSLQGIADLYDFRIISRVLGNYDVCIFYGDDIRIKNIPRK